jgi:four helix bundle protein
MEYLESIVEEKNPVYNIKHRAFYFARDVVLFIGKQKYERIYFSLYDQLLRSVTSIGANLVEGMSGASKNDFIKFQVIALKSANETKYWLSLMKETLEVDKENITNFIMKANEIANIIVSIIINTKKNSQ